MNNKKKILYVIIALIVVVVVAIIFAVSWQPRTNENETTTVNETTIEETTLEDLEIPVTDENGEIITEEKTTENQENQDETNYWDNVEVFEGDGDAEDITDENGMVVEEDYPGQAQGWSPIVSPEDLE